MRRPSPVTTWSTSGWNRLVLYWFRRRVLDVRPASVEQWRHPWRISPAWNAEREEWAFSIVPSGCPSPTSGGDPVVRVPGALAGAEARSRLAIDEDDADLHDVYLSELPTIPIPADAWRSIGTDAVGAAEFDAEPVPEALARLGVASPVVVSRGPGGLVSRTEGLVVSRSRARLLRAVDVVLSHDRLATETRASIEPEGLVTVEMVLANRASADRDARLTVVPRFEEPVSPDSLALLTGSATDPARDSLHLATIYLVSQRGERSGASPDGSWTAHVRHFVHWPLRYVVRQSAAFVEPTRVTVPAPDLGGGTLGSVGGRITAAINNNLAEMESALSTVRNEGRFQML